MLDLAVSHEPDVGARAAHVECDHVAAACGESEMAARYDPARKARQHGLHRVTARRGDEHAPAVRLHDRDGAGEAALGQAGIEVAGKAEHDRRQIGVGDRCRVALVLAPHGSRAVRLRHRDAWEPLLEECREAPLVRRLGKREEEADGDRDIAPLAGEQAGDAVRDTLEFLIGERRDDATIRRESLEDTNAVSPGHERLRLGPVEIVWILLVDAADHRNVLEPRRREKEDAASLSLEQRVRTDGRADRHRGRRGGIDSGRLEGVKDRLCRRRGRRGPFADHELPGLVVEHDEVGERAPGIDAHVKRHESPVRRDRWAVPRQPVVVEKCFAAGIAEVGVLPVNRGCPDAPEQRPTAEPTGDERRTRPVTAQGQPLAHRQLYRMPWRS